MKIYLVKRNPMKVDWDEYDQVVVKAKDEYNANRIAIEFSSDFREDDVEVIEVHLDDKEEVVLGSFCAG